MKKIAAVGMIILVLILVGIIFGNRTGTYVDNRKTKVGVLLNDYRDDGSWNQSHYIALEKCRNKLNLNVLYKEKVGFGKQCEKAIKDLIKKGCKVIIGTSYEYGDSMYKMSEKNPGIYFIHITGVKNRKNLSSYIGRMYQIRYLSGIVAGMKTRTNKIGYVAANNISEVNRGINAFTRGVRLVNKNANVYVRTCGSWNDDKLAKEATEKLLENNDIDVITLHVNSLEPLEVAKEKGIYSIGYNIDNSEFYDEKYLTSAKWKWEKYYEKKIMECIQGKFVGEHCWGDISMGIVSFGKMSSLVDKKTIEIVNREEKKMKEGTFDVFYGPVKDNRGNVRIKDGESMTDELMLNRFDWYVEGVVEDEK